MSSFPADIIIEAKGVSKSYRIWRDPAARIKGPLWECLGGLVPSSLQPRFLRHRAGSHGGSPYFRDFFALRDVTFEVRRGEVLGVIGRNGSGKSTLLQIIAGTLTPSTGSVRVEGRVAALLELGSGFNPEFTGRENVFLNAGILGLSRAETAERFGQVANFADIGEFIDQPVKTYSSGMTMRLAFAVQALTEPQVLIVDEALAVGDEAFQRKCFARIEALKKGGATIILVSHDAASVAQLCDRALVLSHGRLVFSGAPREAIKAYQRLMYGVTDVAEGPDRSSAPTDASTSVAPPPAHYDPGLRSETIEHYPCDTCAIEKCEIRDEEGRTVNLLYPRRHYRLVFQVALFSPHTAIRFGTSIKNPRGTVIAGCFSSTREQRIALAGPGRHEVSFEFSCLLAPGPYFLNAGVFHQKGDGAETFLTRIVDALLFKVLPADGEPTSTEIVELITPAGVNQVA